MTLSLHAVYGYGASKIQACQVQNNQMEHPAKGSSTRPGVVTISVHYPHFIIHDGMLKYMIELN